MTYQPFPTGSGSNEVAGSAIRPPKPPALRNAVRLMWVRIYTLPELCGMLRGSGFASENPGTGRSHCCSAGRGVDPPYDVFDVGFLHRKVEHFRLV